MRKIYMMISVCVMFLWFVTSCDSLWVLQQKGDVSFNVNLSELLRENSLNSVKPIQSRGVLPGGNEFENDDDGTKVTVSLHRSFDNGKIDSQELSVSEAQNTNVRFTGISLNQTLYAKIIIVREDGELVFSARTLDTKIKSGDNTLIARPNMMFISSNGLHLVHDDTDNSIFEGSWNSSKVPNLSALEQAYERMLVDGILLPSATVYTDVPLPIESGNPENYNFPGLTIAPSNDFSGGAVNSVESGATLVLDGVTIKGVIDTPAINITSGGTVQLFGNVSVDSIFYEPLLDSSSGGANPIQVKGGLSSGSRIALFPIASGRDLKAGDVLVENAGGRFTRDNFIVQGLPQDLKAEINANGHLVVTEEGSGDVTPPDGQVYTITFDAGAGVLDSSLDKATIEDGGKLTTIPTPTREGYSFEGWFTNSDGTGDKFTTSTVVTGDSTVYAKWTIKQYTVSFNHNDGTNTVISENVNHGGVLSSLPSPSRIGFTLDGWYENSDGSGDKFTTSTVVTGDSTVYAKWTAVASGDTYTVMFNANGGTLDSASPSSINVAEGGTVILPGNPTHASENFTGWYTVSGYSQQNESNIFSSKTQVTESITVYARWMTDNSDTNYTYTLNPLGDSFTAVGKNTALSDSITLPSNYSHKPVTILGNNGYENYTNVKFITLSSGVTEIGESAFVGCNSLTRITIPDTITKIGSNAFSGVPSWVALQTTGSATLAGFSSTEGSQTVAFASWQEIPEDTIIYPIWQ